MTWFRSFIGASVFRTLPIFAAASGAMLVAEMVYILFGFGAGLIAVGSMAMLLEQVTDVVVVLLLLSLPPELYVVCTNRGSVTWRSVGLICAGNLVGVPLGTLALDWGDASFILLLLGGFLVLAGLTFLLLPRRERAVRWPVWSAPLVGLLSGVLGGLFGTGGPPLIIYYRLAKLDKASFRSNLMAIFLLITLVRLPSYGMAGLITAPRAIGAALVAPAALLGALLGNRIHLELREETFERMVALALLLIGALLLAR